MTREQSKINSTVPGGGQNTGYNDFRASPGVPRSTWHRKEGSCPARALGRNQSIPRSMFPTAAASPLLEEFGQGPKMQRSFSLCVTHDWTVLWRLWDTTHGLFRIRLSCESPGKVVSAVPLWNTACVSMTQCLPVMHSDKQVEASRVLSQLEDLALMQCSANAALLSLLPMIAQ